MAAFDGATDPVAWGHAFGALGPIGFLLIPLGFALAVIVVVAIAWIIVGHGIRAELHGLRLDLRLFQREEPLPDLEPLEAPKILGPLAKLAPEGPRAPSGSLRARQSKSATPAAPKP